MQDFINSGTIEIVDFQPEYAQVFKELNYQWIEQYFKVEASDQKMLEDPDTYILNKGGVILVALLKNKPVGVCALIKMDAQTYELAKMAVAPSARGHKVGWMLGLSILHKARTMNAKKLYLETNSILQPAINLYKKLGFREIQGADSPYQRCNVQMELVFN